ncbi:hypothetical protein LSH36_176g00016 [Paralvinella palmiformis]|uniref:Kinase n=1 Tax=Paralvinella palmiformis TaxID=53620 RepID=A0AAD9JRJ7_9ANNE|nr:hypothetical protein LSH36_176g00016 [Paralvinella palmiformis]
MHTSKSCDKMDDVEVKSKGATAKAPPTEFPPPGYRPTPVNKLLVNALDLTVPASDAVVKTRKNAWVQVAGHPGSFAPASPNTIWKKRLSKENYETDAYHALMNDVVKDMVPKFHREVEYSGETFIEIEDLLQHFNNPTIIDIKMGTRTFMESEVKNQNLRSDLYEKMIKINIDEPTQEEHKQRAITKLRYMQFRERDSSTSSLGFRLEAIKMPNEEPNADLKKIKTEIQVKQMILHFLQQNKVIHRKLLKRLKEMRRKIELSKFFKHHEVIGSSVLILCDNTHAGAWMIDFAKTLHVEDRSLNHRTSWHFGNHEDGYLTGIDNLIRIFSELNITESMPCKVVGLLAHSVEREVDASTPTVAEQNSSSSERNSGSSEQLQKDYYDSVGHLSNDFMTSSRHASQNASVGESLLPRAFSSCSESNIFTNGCEFKAPPSNGSLKNRDVASVSMPHIHIEKI